MDQLLDEALVQRFAAIVGSDNVITDTTERAGFAHDKLPYANFRARENSIVGTLPSFVVRPGSTREVQDVVRLAAELDLPLIPYGNGSGVLGGTIPLTQEVLIDTRRMDRIQSVDEENRLVVVDAGMNGADFEEALNQKGYTAGHLPQSLTISTVGGWAACRGGGQESSRYGKAEHIIVGFKAVLSNGELLESRALPKRATGPSIRDLIVGSEGTLAIVTELTFRLWALPKAEESLVFGFPDQDAAQRLARTIMQAGLHPRIVRIYDAKESAARVKDHPEFADHPILATIAVCGEPQIAAAEAEFVKAEAVREGAVRGPQAPFDAWRATRFESISKVWQDKGYYNDTIEVTVNWSAASQLYQAIDRQVADIHPDAHFSAHWSHIYVEGVCQYMTVRLPPMPQEQALPLHAELWELIQRETLAHGGTISHHHGCGLFRGPWMESELGATGFEVLKAIKTALDPQNLFNPGKLGLPVRDGSIDPYRARAKHG